MAMYLGGQAVKIIERSKNLIPFPYTYLGNAINKTETINGIIFKLNADGTITANGTATAGIVKYVFFTGNKEEMTELSAGKYIITDGTTDEDYSTHCLSIRGILPDGSTTYHTYGNPNVPECKFEGAYFRISQGTTLNNAILKPMVYKGNVRLPFSKKGDIIPFRIRSGVNMGRNPKNLIPFPYVWGTRTEKGVEYAVNEDGTIVLNGTNEARHFYHVYQNIKLKDGKSYIFSGCPDGGGFSTYSLYINEYIDGVWSNEWYDNGTGVVFTAKGNAVYGIAIYCWTAGTKLDNITFKPMLNEGTKALPYYYYD